MGSVVVSFAERGGAHRATHLRFTPSASLKNPLSKASLAVIRLLGSYSNILSRRLKPFGEKDGPDLVLYQ